MENKPPKKPPEQGLRSRALRALAQREHTRFQLAQKLRAHAASEGELTRLLDTLEQQGKLSDARYAEHVATFRGRKYGALRLKQELRASGVDEEVLAPVISGLRQSETARARATWRKRFGHLPRNALERAKQVRFLQGRGYTLDTIIAILKSDDDEA